MEASVYRTVMSIKQREEKKIMTQRSDKDCGQTGGRVGRVFTKIAIDKQAKGWRCITFCI